MTIFITRTHEYKILAAKMDADYPGWDKDRAIKRQIKRTARKMIKNENTTKHKALD